MSKEDRSAADRAMTAARDYDTSVKAVGGEPGEGSNPYGLTAISRLM